MAEGLDPALPLRAALQRLGIPVEGLAAVNRLRVALTSSASPLLRAL